MEFQVITSYFQSIQQAKKEYTRILEPVCTRYSLTRSEIDILLFLLNNPELDRAADIVKCRGIAKSHVSLSVGTLEEKGLLCRRESTSDRRTVHLMLCDSGLKIALEAQILQKEFFRHIFAGLTPEEMALWRRITEKVSANIQNMEIAQTIQINE